MPTTDSSTVKYQPKHHLPIERFINQRYGALTILSEGERQPKYLNTRHVLCRCDCGKEASLRLPQVISGHITSCGCHINRVKHGHAPDGNMSRTYVIWHSMKQRCQNANDSAYHNYGAKGITVCESWNKFVNFLADMGEPPSPKHTLDRIENSLGYCKENCRWATRKEQNRNTSQNRYLTFKEQTHCIVEWAEITGIPRKAIDYRLSAGWSVEDILTTPPIPRSQRRTWRR